MEGKLVASSMSGEMVWPLLWQGFPKEEVGMAHTDRELVVMHAKLSGPITIKQWMLGLGILHVPCKIVLFGTCRNSKG